MGNLQVVHPSKSLKKQFQAYVKEYRNHEVKGEERYESYDLSLTDFPAYLRPAQNL